MSSRKSIYYWKSDRPYTNANTQPAGRNMREIELQLQRYIHHHFREGDMTLKPAGGQGNHITYLAIYQDQTYFVRLENGPENDNYMEVESAVLRKVHGLGVPSPAVFLSDTSRTEVPFAIQIIEFISSKDLNELEKNGILDTVVQAAQIGKFIAKWQEITPVKYGLFNPLILRDRNILEGYHDSYREYFLLNWNTHLLYLQQSGFLSKENITEIKRLVEISDSLLDISQGCLVHKDLALWNILGNSREIHAFIDWSDTVSGDPSDDLSLLGCFHPGNVVTSAIEGYSCVKKLPGNFEKRFWLHLLRNIILKAVIRVKGNYFNKPDSFFMSNSRIESLEQFTLDRIFNACEGLKGNKRIMDL